MCRLYVGVWGVKIDKYIIEIIIGIGRDVYINISIYVFGIL